MHEAGLFVDIAAALQTFSASSLARSMVDGRSR
jgi:hypothetical protein